MSHSWYENEDPSSRKFSLETEESAAPLSRATSKIRRKKTSESLANSVASNLNRITGGPLELNKMFLTDDYFSDVNPRSMRRLMNVIYGE